MNQITCTATIVRLLENNIARIRYAIFFWGGGYLWSTGCGGVLEHHGNTYVMAATGGDFSEVHRCHKQSLCTCCVALFLTRNVDVASTNPV